MKWCHHYLYHPDEARIYHSLESTIYWEKMEDEIRQFVKQCPACQMIKKKKMKYGKVPPKIVELIAWEIVCIDLVGPSTVTGQKLKQH